MKLKFVIKAVGLYLMLALLMASTAQAAPLAGGTSAPALPPNTIASPPKCDPSTDLCITVFQSTSGKTTGEALAASPTTNLYICGVDIIRNGDHAWLGRLQQNVYGSWGWGQYQIQWKLTSGNLSTSAALGYWWGDLNGPNPDVPWGTITLAEHVSSGARLYPVFNWHWVDAYFQASGGYSCSGA
jgi:hypothetical protein